MEFIKFDKEQHKYFSIDGSREIPSVTTIINTVLGCGFDNNNIFVRRAQEKGTIIHNAIENYVKENKEPDFPMIELENFIELSDKYLHAWDMSEQIIYNEIDGFYYAGTLDLYDSLNCVLADVKTGSTKLLRKWQLQLSFYAWALIDKLGLSVKKLVVLWLHDDIKEYIELDILPKSKIVEVLKQYYIPEEKPLVVLDSCSIDTGEKLKVAIEAIKRIESEIEEFKQKILQEMQAKQIEKYSDGNITITYIAPTTRKSVDSKKLKQNEPEIYEKYLKVSDVKGSIKISVNGDK